MCQRLLANPVIERYTVEIDRWYRRERVREPGSVATSGPERRVSAESGIGVGRCSRARTASSTSQWAVEALGGEAELLWHGDRAVRDVDAVVVPGGFAHGDYLRTGAIARFSPVMDAVAEFAAAGGPVVGICNGFQVLTEAGLLPGALQKNAGLTFVCDTVELEVVSTRSVLTNRRRARARGCASRSTTSRATTCATPRRWPRLRADDRIVVRYVDNPNGSLDDIAGISNEAGNVVGLMPHPERASDALLGSADGVVLLESLLAPRCSGDRRVGGAHEPLEMPAFLSTSAEHPQLTPRGVGDALALRVLGRRSSRSPTRAPTGRPWCSSPPTPSGGPSAPGPAGAVGGRRRRRTRRRWRRGAS